MKRAIAADTAAFLGFTGAMPTFRPDTAADPRGGTAQPIGAAPQAATPTEAAPTDAAVTDAAPIDAAPAATDSASATAADGVLPVGGAVPVGQAVPILPSADLDRALACYRYLGFHMLGRVSDYLRLALGPVELHLYLEPGLDPVHNSSGCYLRVADPAMLRTAWSADGVNCLDVPGSGAYGPSLFAVIDSDGNTLRIGPLAERGDHEA